MLNNKEVYSFDLNELLYFNEGQEIAEMVGISLSPEISIQPINGYISIRGVVELKGEYIKANSDSGEIANINLEDYNFRRYFEKTEEITHDRATFLHRFPVEISVPEHRISDLDDITVSVESFDYTIQSPNELKLTSTIDIYGISEQGIIEEKKEEKLVTEDEFEFNIELDEQKSEAENKEPVENNVIEHPVLIEDEESEKTDVDILKEQEVIETIPEETKLKSELEESNVSRQQDEELNVKEVIEEAEEKEVVEKNEEVETPKVSLVEEIEDLATHEHEPVISIEKDDSPKLEENEEEVEETLEDVTYLSDMFQGFEGQGSSTQIRVRIVQHDDTIESIAKKYDLSVLQIINTNELENDEIQEGQLLHIPQN